MKRFLPYIPYVLVALLIVFVFTLFMSLRKEDNSSYKKVIEVYDQLLKSKDEVIASKKELNLQLDDRISDLEKRDSVLEIHYNQNQVIYSKLNDQLKNIPTRIAAIANNDDSIRAAFAR